MFPMTLTVHTRQQLDAVIEALAAGNDYAEQKAKTTEPPQAKAEVKKSGAAQTADKTSTTTTEVAAPTHDEPNAPAATYEDVAKAIIALSKEKGRDAAVAVLNKLGVAKATDLTPEEYAKAIAAAKAAQGGE